MQPTFEDFVTTRGSWRALAAVRSLLQDRGDGQRLVLVHGPTGVGKTHLLRAAALQSGIIAQAAFVADIVRTILEPGLGDSRGGLLIVDDLHVLARMSISQREVGRYLEERVRGGGRVLAAAAEPAELPDLMDRLGRIRPARFVEMRPPGTGEMVRLLLVFAARSGIRLEPVGARAMAARCRSDVRLAQGAVARLRFAESMRG